MLIKTQCCCCRGGSSNIINNTKIVKNSTKTIKNVLSVSYRSMKIFKFESFYDKIKRKMDEDHKKFLRHLRNQRYYERHKDEFRIRRKEYYELTGK